ncbi:unnamed protein product [Alternaria alternata]
MPSLASPSREDHEKVKTHIASVLEPAKEVLDQAIQDLQDMQDGSKGETAVLRESWFPDQISRNSSGRVRSPSARSSQDWGNAIMDTAKNPIVPWLMYWAVIKIDPKLEWSNNLEDPKHTKLTGGIKGKTRLNDLESANYYHILNPRELDCEVAFHGRTSGWEIAELDCTQSLLNPIYCGEGRPSGKMGELDGRYMVSREKPGYCWSFVPRSGYMRRDPCSSGDSGSVVLLDPEAPPAHKGDNWWVGFLFGHEHKSVGYMTPIENVIKDIEAVMNGKVVVPERA